MYGQQIRPVRSTTILLQVQPNINQGGTMALARLRDSERVVGRGLLTPMEDIHNIDQQSCVFQGTLKDGVLTPENVLISPKDRPLTGEGATIYGYEDPSPEIDSSLNFIEPGYRGIFLTEAYYRSGMPTPWGTNIFYYGLETSVAETILTCQ